LPRLLGLSALALFCRHNSLAETTAQAAALSLPEALQSALNHPPASLQLDSQAKLRLAENLATLQRPNPELATKLSGISANPTVEISYSAQLDVLGKQLRQSYSMAERSSAKAERQLQIIAILNDTTQAWYRVYLAQVELQLLQSNQAELQQLLPQLRQAAKQAQISLVELGLIESSILENTLLQQQAAYKLSQAQAYLMRCIGAQKPRALSSLQLVQLPEQADKLIAFGQKRSALRQALQARQVAAEQNLAVELARQKNALSWQVIAEHEKEQDNALMLGVGFSVPLPLYGRNQAAVEIANAKLQQVRANQLEQRPQAYAAEMRQLLAAARMSVDNAKQHALLVEKLTQTLEAARQALKQGQANPLLLWQISEKLAAARMQAVELQARVLESRSAIEQLLCARLEQAL